jgi:hypothetical protein
VEQTLFQNLSVANLRSANFAFHDAHSMIVFGPRQFASLDLAPHLIPAASEKRRDKSAQ